MTRSERRLGTSLVLASLLLATSAHAEPSAIQKSTADALFKEGKKLLDAKDFDAACPKLAESATLQPGGGVQLALAICHEGQGKLATAYNDYREALAMAKRDKRQDREDIAAAKLAELEPKLSRLVLDVSEAARAQTIAITLDGAALSSASWGIPIPVDGGTHTVVVTDCYRTRVPDPVAEPSGATFAPCRDAVVAIRNEQLTVNGTSYGPLARTARVVVDHGRVSIEAAEHTR